MRRAIKKASTVSLVCSREGCQNNLSRTQKKFCSHECRNMTLSPGSNGGAPTKYRPDFASKFFNEYIKECEKDNEPSLIPTKSSYVVQSNARIPTNEDYAEWLVSKGYLDKIDVRSFHNWSIQYTDFAHTMHRLKRIQKIWLLNNGLSGRYSPQIAKLLLGMNHGMIEKKEIDNTHKMIGVVKAVYQRADELEKERRG